MCWSLVLALSLTCGGDDGGAGSGTIVEGRAAWSGPLRGATVVAFQLVDGARTLEVGRGLTDADGGFAIALGATYEHVELDVVGGTYAELAGGEVALDAGTVMRGVVLELALNEHRVGVTVSPWTELAVALGRARHGAGAETTYAAAVTTAIARLGAHLGFDPTRTAIAPVSATAASPTEPVRHALALAGLSQLAALAAAEQGATVQSVNTVVLTEVLRRDAASIEARFDGNGAEPLFVGATCPPPVGCQAEGPGCYATCAVHAGTLRARLGSAVLTWLLTATNRTGLARDDVMPWLEAMRRNRDAELFGDEPIEPFDAAGPSIAWQAPAADATVAGSIAIEVTAGDALGVISLSVTAGTATPLPLTDVDPAPDRFAATLATAGLPEGALVLTAAATDTEDNRSEARRGVVVNNLVGGTVSGVVVKGRVGGGAVRVYGFAGGVRGALVGQGTTASDGSFTNVAVADGVSGPLLIEAGAGGTYAEEAASAAVTLDVADRMRTVVPDYSDGGAVAGLTVSPLTSFAVTYLGYLDGAGAGGATLAARWASARGAMEAHFGVASIGELVPLAPAEMATFNAQARYGMVLVGLSELARTASTLGGGDGGTFGPAMNAMRVVRALELDLADGCWDGRQGAAPLFFGGTQAVTPRATRLELASAIASYLGDGARNQSPYAGAADVLSLLDTLASGGGNDAPGACASGHLHPDDGGPFDQTPPVISVTTTPAGPVLGGVITVDAVASDALDLRPTLRFTAPAGAADQDGDATDADARASLDTRVLVPTEGPLVVALESFDDAGNRGTGERTLTVDNVAPTLTLGGVADGAWYEAAVVPVVAATDSHLVSLSLILDGAAFTSGTPVAAEGRHVLVAAALDQAGNTTTRTVTFHVDRTAPALAVAPPDPSGTWLRGMFDVTAVATDTLMSAGSLGSDIAVTATGPGGAVTPVVTYPLAADGSRQIRVRVDTTAIDDAAGGGTLAIQLAVSDRAGHTTTRAIVTLLDNAAPAVTLAPIHNQAGVVLDGFVNEPTATLRGTVSPGGSPTTVTITITPGAITGVATPDAAGQWSWITPALAEGTFTVATDAHDLAGNDAATPPSRGLTVDRSGPIASFRPSRVVDERACTVSYPHLDHTTGVLSGAPVVYACPTSGVELTGGTAVIGKYTSRLASLADNPIAWQLQASEASGAGVAASPDTIQLRVHRSGEPPPATWIDSAAPLLNGGSVESTGHVLATAWPELLTHTGRFVIELRARDRLGNLGPPVTATWEHHPLAPPVPLFYQGLAPQTSSDPLWSWSIFRHALTPVAGQAGPAEAMSTTALTTFAPRGLFELTVWNPHDTPLTVGFFVPGVAGATYTRRVWDTSPWISGSPGTVAAPAAGTCPADPPATPWPSPLWAARINHSAPYNCATGSCTCNRAGWDKPTEPAVHPDTASSTFAIASGAGQHPFRVVAYDATDAAWLTPLGLQPTIAANGTHTFHEVTIPPRVNPSLARRIRVLVALPNLDLFTPSTSIQTNPPQESDGPGTEVLKRGGNIIVTTAAFYERWGDCAFTSNGFCTSARARHRYRVLVEGRLAVPLNSLAVNLRSRATAATTAAPEDVAQEGDTQNRNPAPFLWEACEVGGYAGGACTPFVATTSLSDIN